MKNHIFKNLILKMNFNDKPIDKQKIIFRKDCKRVIDKAIIKRIFGCGYTPHLIIPIARWYNIEYIDRSVVESVYTNLENHYLNKWNIKICFQGIEGGSFVVIN